MKTINVLVTGIGGPTAQGILHGLAQQDHVRKIGADRRKVTTGNQFCDTVYQIPRYSDTAAYKQAIKDIIEKESIDAVFPALHEEIELYTEFRHELKAKVALPETNAFDVLMDKEKTYIRLQEAGLQKYIPKYTAFTTAEELRLILSDSYSDDPYVVAKNVSGYGAMGFAILTDRKRYLEALKLGQPKVVSLEDYCEILTDNRKIVMEYLKGKEYSVDLFLHDGKVVTAVPRERTGVSSGIVLDGLVVRNAALIHAAEEIAPVLAHGGFLNLQFFESDDGYKLTDVNARFCGSQVMSLGAGVNFPYLYLQYTLLDEKVQVSPRWNTRMMRYRVPLFFYNGETEG